MTIADIEKAIVERLYDKIRGLEIKGYAHKTEKTVLQDTKQYMMAQKGNILVVYAGSDYSDSEDTSVVVQKRTVWMDVILTMRDLKDHRSAYPYLDSIRVALTGFKPADCTKMRPFREDFIDDSSGKWQYGIRFKTECMNIEMPDNELEVLLKRITLDSPYGQQIIEKD